MQAGPFGLQDLEATGPVEQEGNRDQSRQTAEKDDLGHRIIVTQMLDHRIHHGECEHAGHHMGHATHGIPRVLHRLA